jgi:hypothetical protein
MNAENFIFVAGIAGIAGVEVWCNWGSFLSCISRFLSHYLKIIFRKKSGLRIGGLNKRVHDI